MLSMSYFQISPFDSAAHHRMDLINITCIKYVHTGTPAPLLRWHMLHYPNRIFNISIIVSLTFISNSDLRVCVSLFVSIFWDAIASLELIISAVRDVSDPGVQRAGRGRYLLSGVDGWMDGWMRYLLYAAESRDRGETRGYPLIIRRVGKLEVSRWRRRSGKTSQRSRSPESRLADQGWYFLWLEDTGVRGNLYI
jgi:hypothetical protein